jgi:MFS family permease
LQGINSIMYYMPSIAAAVGFRTNTALGQTGVNGVVNFLSTFLAFIFVDRFGRRPLLMYGALVMGLSMAVLGVLGALFISVDDLTGRTVVHSEVAAWACVVSIYVFVFGFAWSWGPVCWLYPTEAFPTAQRAKGVSITTASNFALNIVIAQFVPQLQSDVLHFGLFSIFAFCCALMFVFVQCCLPETRRKSLEELTRAFDKTLAAAPS